MANNTNDVLAQILDTANKRAAEYDELRKAMLAKRQATRDAANMAQDLASVLGLPAPELSPEVTKVLAKRQSRKGSDDEGDE